MILADTSVWIEHLRGREPRLPEVLETDEILMHPFVVGELACGNLRNRRELLSLWQRLTPATSASHDEVLVFVDQHQLMGRGLGYVDVHLLASAALSSARLWTNDRPLIAAAAKLGLAFRAA
jgi:predicted nucleic acid-binding protein